MHACTIHELLCFLDYRLDLYLSKPRQNDIVCAFCVQLDFVIGGVPNHHRHSFPLTTELNLSVHHKFQLLLTKVWQVNSGLTHFSLNRRKTNIMTKINEANFISITSKLI